MHSHRLALLLSVFTSLALGASSALATPLSGEVLHFEQLPLNGGLAPSTGGAPYNGQAGLSTATEGLFGVTYSGTSLADDFALTTPSPIVYVEWWGSYLNPGTNANGVQQFMISFETDVAATQTVPSHPGLGVVSQIVTKGALAPASGTFTEAAVATPQGASQLYHYSAELSIPMVHLADSVFWLRIVALVNPGSDGNMQWGWQSRDYSATDTYASPVPVPGEHLVPNNLNLSMSHFQDSAVSSGITILPVPQSKIAGIIPGAYTSLNYVNAADGPTGINQYGRDLAFRIYAMPEPSSLALLGFGGVAMAVAVYRRRGICK